LVGSTRTKLIRYLDYLKQWLLDIWLKSFLNNVSLIVLPCQNWHLNLLQIFVELRNMLFPLVLPSSRFLFSAPLRYSISHAFQVVPLCQI
jgi:hypothetical protein